MFSVTRVVSIFLLGCLTVSFNSMAQGDSVAIINLGCAGSPSGNTKPTNSQPSLAKATKSGGADLKIRTSGELDSYTAHHLLFKYKPKTITDEASLKKYVSYYEPSRDNALEKGDEFTRKDIYRALESEVRAKVATIPNNVTYVAEIEIPISSTYHFEKGEYLFHGSGLYNEFGYISFGDSFTANGRKYSDNWAIFLNNGRDFTGLKMKNESEARALKPTMAKYDNANGGIPARLHIRVTDAARVQHFSSNVAPSQTIFADLIKLELFKDKQRTQPWKTFSSAGT